jgi:hypothetical protein
MAADPGRVARQQGRDCRRLVYRLYTSCERQTRAAAALSENRLAQSRPEATRLTREHAAGQTQPAQLFEQP